MKPLLIAVLGVLVLTCNASTSIGSDIEYATTTPTALIEPQATTTPETSELSFTQIKQRISQYSELYGVSSVEMYDIVHCESNFNPLAVSSTSDYGLTQINKVWGFSKEQMFNVDFSLNFLAEQLSLHHDSYWVCYKLLTDT